MIIKIKSEEHKFTIPIPNGLVFNGVTAKLISKINDMPLTKDQFNLLFRELNRAKRILGNRPLIEVDSKDGESIYIKL